MTLKNIIMADRVAITGVGIISSIGNGKREYWDALKEGKVGYKPISLFDTAQFLINMACEVFPYDPKVFMGQKGLRTLDRSTTLLVSASKFAVSDCGFVITEENTDDVGVSVGTTLGSLKSISDFDMITLTEGPRYVNPAHFPNTVINSPASQVSIWNNIQGFNTTLSTGFTSSIDAMKYAADFLMFDRVKLVFTGSVEELCLPTYLGFHSLRYLSGSKEGDTFVNCPFDRRRNGVTFGEGACLLAFEDMDQAQKRGANIMAEVQGFGYYFDPFKLHKFNPKGTGMVEAMRRAIEDAECEPKDIDCIFANANSTQGADKIETQAIKEVFGTHAYKIPVTAVKSMVGECYSATGSFAAAAAVGAIVEDFIPPTMNYKEKDPDCDLDYVPNKSRKAKLNRVLVNSFGPSGNNSCMVIGRYKP